MRTVAKRLVRIAVSLLTLWLVATGLRGDGARWLIASAASNPIAVENSQTGNPASEWDIGGAGDSSIQGFATDISVNTGQTVIFKVKTNSTNYKIDIYRLGYYGGNGARKVATTAVTSASVLARPVFLTTLPQGQGGCATNDPTGLTDCGTWEPSASWLSTNAVSGIYVAKLTRNDTGGSSHIVFIVRDDARQADVVMQTSDTTWQAYNQYGNGSLYCGGPVSNAGTVYALSCATRSTKVSYNRPFDTRDHDARSFLFGAEYPMVRWLEANGYDVKYWAGVDTDRRGTELIGAHKPKAFFSVGHDEYWSGNQRTMVENARNAGVNMAFFSGNEMFWKTRYEASIDGANTAYRTLVSYKETLKGVKSDPAVDAAGRPIWTGTWRDPRFSPPGDGGRPENGVTGTIWTVNSGTSAITVPAAMSGLRFWHNTRVATLPFGGIATLSPESLGYEWDEDLDNGARPAGLAHLSSTTVDGVEKIIDFGATTGIGTATHSLTLYRQGTALVFGAGTVQWSWGLDSIHDGGAPAAHVADQAMQQSTVNLMADMGAQPTTLQIGANPLKPLIAASASTDTFAPTSVITSPTASARVQSGVSATITGTATDNGGGVVASVEVSVDGGATWHIAQGAASWSFNWLPGALGPVTIRSRAIDDSGNLEVPTGISVIVVTSCPCTSLWDTATVVPAGPDASDAQPVEVGVRFSSDTAGFITSLRFYKSVNNTGTHVGNLWTSTGTLQGSAIFTNETASGWQEVDFAAPVAIAANTTYIASYHTNAGHYAADAAYFATAGVNSAPLHAPAAGTTGNGVYKYGASAFPTDTYNATNYWVDVVYGTGAPDTTPPVVSSVTPANGATAVSTGAIVTATFYETMDASTVTSSTFVLRDPANIVVPSTVSYNVATSVATVTPTAALALATTYTATITGGSGGVKDLAGNALVGNVVWSFTTGAGPTCPCTIWNAAATPGQLPGDGNAVELGLRFRAEATGTISGIRFYKAAANTGTHTGSLWTNAGTQLATTTFINETASGWQQVNFSSPINVTANTTYVASYHTNTGNYGFDGGTFASAGVDSAPLHALATGVDGANSVYLYGAHAFPTQTYNAANYWVDIVYNTGADTTPPAVLSVTPANGATAVSTGATATATFSEPMDATTITSGNFVLRGPTNVIVPSTVGYNVATGVAILTPAAELAAATTYTATITGGSGGVKDIAGNALPGSVVWSFTTPMCPCTIWNASATPGQLPSDANAVELGLRFRADSTGTITGVRFYKADNNTGTHIGSLWTNTGTLLATATFIDESASGWQQVNFSSPVNVTANTTYVVSYHTDTGNYAFDGGTFESAGIDNAPLHALATGVDGANSVYRYGSNAFPTETYNAANYWVDVVYQ